MRIGYWAIAGFIISLIADVIVWFGDANAYAIALALNPCVVFYKTFDMFYTVSDAIGSILLAHFPIVMLFILLGFIQRMSRRYAWLGIVPAVVLGLLFSSTIWLAFKVG
ncbi:MAG: hypothetical protein PQJ28_04530 [Spirochaetales bacterium]|nr:hypothetical protein [Spirochaetales bacterium]